MEYSARFNIKPNKAGEFVDWLKKNDQLLRDHTQPGWTYKETRLTVQAIGDHDAEMRWDIDDYAALGADLGGDEWIRLLREFVDEFYDDRFPQKTTLSKTVEDVVVPEGF